MNREQVLLQEIQKVLPDGASIESELKKYPGHTKTQRMIKLLEDHNEEKLPGQDLEGYFTGAFESKGHYYWRLTLNNGFAIVGVDNTQLKPPEFGQKIKITNVDKIHYKVSDRDTFALSFDAKYTVLEGHVIDVAPDLNDNPEGYGLMNCNLYKVDLVGDGQGGKKPIVDERGFNIKITVRGEEGEDRRYASGFINSLENLLALIPTEEQAEISILIEQDDDMAVIDAISAHCYNQNFQFKGANLLLYGNLKSSEGRDKTFWNIGIMKIFNVDNLGVEVHRIANPVSEMNEPIKEEATTEALEEAFAKVAAADEDAKKEEEQDPEATTLSKTEEFKHNSVVDIELKETIMASLKAEPCKAMLLINKVIEESEAARQEVVDNLNELYTKGYIITKDRMYQVAKEL